MTITSAMHDACRAVGIIPPPRAPQGKWIPCPADGKNKRNGAGRVFLFPDGSGGMAWNWITAQRIVFRAGDDPASPILRARGDDQARARADAERRAEAAQIARRIVAGCEQAAHPYLAAKGFPDEPGLVIADPRPIIPGTPLGQAVARALPEEWPLLVIPGRIGRDIATAQFVAPAGEKKNLYGGTMRRAAHRIASGRETWVCEGIATALSVRAALRFLGRSATVFCAFAASNVARVAMALRGAVIAADNDRPLDQLGGIGTGEFHALSSGCRWIMPPEPGDYNDWHQRAGLRAVAMHLQGVRAG